jgi:Nickel responsive protein SCO4226-like
MTGSRSEYLAECFWPGVEDADLHALDKRVAAIVDEAQDGVRYLGSLLMRVDEVVLCLFEGSEAAVRRTATRAEVPFERILEAAQSPWPAGRI